MTEILPPRAPVNRDEDEMVSSPVALRAQQPSYIAHWRASDQTPQTLAAHLQGVGRLASVFATKGIGDACAE